ncbi:ABC-transporter, permease protein, ABC-2 family [Formosa agariphila KMM 3901]|uniref:ABC-transporter, permease protein, ABC-2 family n=1 Tax=Formosa agariphila (strain DSM 15362 / KCTC 12365 / LMG 23005 / KMM 3901 / M-2Alg 35-1) TaxID=1347342 RepID=T2KLZ9_FORAG|nr:ABC transporter permease [Formosa agariphila]CDF79456.1 ABC-transporter, permease protein, ABC-2 family [Formosa agariphila KMM 3901]
MKNWISLLKREFRLFSSNSVIMAIFIGAPLAYGLLFGAVYKKGKVDNLPILVIDLDNTPMSHNLIDMLDDNEVVVPNVVHNQNNIRQLVIDTEYSTILTIPERFEADIIQKRHPEVQVEVNTANILTANYASKAIQVVLGTLNAGIEIEGLKKQGVPAITASTQYESFGVSYVKFFNASANYMEFLWPGMIGVIVQQVFMLALALSFAREFEEHTFFTEFMPKAKNVVNAMFLKTIPFWIMGIVILALIRGMFTLFRIPFDINPVAAVALITALVVSVSFLGVLFSVAIPSQLKATEVLMVIATPSFVVSGFTWPLSQMPEYVVAFANTIPLTHFLEGLRKLMLYHANLSDLMPQIKAMMILAAIFAGLSFILLKLKINRHKEKVA